MKYTYFVAIKDEKTLTPTIIKMGPGNDISFIGRNYWRAYTMEGKTQAERVWKDRRETHEKKLLELNQQENEKKH